jgi:hypothetical protein
MNRVAIMQPTYIGHLPYYAMIDHADTFVLLDTVPISKQSWQTRNRIRTPDGRVHWLSIPTHATYQQPLNEVLIDYGRDWQRKHWRTIESAYRNTLEFLWPCYHEPISHLSVFTGAQISWIATHLQLDTTIIRASTLEPATGKIERLRSILEQTDATSYLATRGSAYLEGSDLGVPIEWFDYQRPTYNQHQSWMPHLSIIDCIAHCSDPLTVIRSGHTVNA